MTAHPGQLGLALLCRAKTGVLLTDLEVNVARLQRAISANSESLHPCMVEAHALDWHDRAAVARLARATPSRSFDVVVAADCNFCHTMHDPLASTLVAAATVRTHDDVTLPPTRVLVAEEERWKDTSAWWAESAAKHGLRMLSETVLPAIVQVPRPVVLKEYVLEAG